jgi:hypothetical protein
MSEVADLLAMAGTDHAICHGANQVAGSQQLHC